jgi:uncharacterized protein YdbL (DUF1318 family)
MSAHFRSLLRALALGAALIGAPLGFCASAAPALAADLAQDKSAVDAAKAKGLVGEQGDGYLGFVKGSADAATTAAVTEINAARADTYRQTAAKTGVSPDAAGQAVAIQLQARMPAGQYFKPLGGSWVQK